MKIKDINYGYNAELTPDDHRTNIELATARIFYQNMRKTLHQIYMDIDGMNKDEALTKAIKETRKYIDVREFK